MGANIQKEPLLCLFFDRNPDLLCLRSIKGNDDFHWFLWTPRYIRRDDFNQLGFSLVLGLIIFGYRLNWKSRNEMKKAILGRLRFNSTDPTMNIIVFSDVVAQFRLIFWTTRPAQTWWCRKTVKWLYTAKRQDHRGRTSPGDARTASRYSWETGRMVSFNPHPSLYHFSFFYPPS